MTILPRSVAEFVPRGVEVRAFADIRPTRTIGIVRRRGVPLSDLGAAMMAAVESELRRHAEEVRADAPHRLRG